jgi:NAD(P)-dependent dehydrogenase (short-subunit alcohol dehydrogenase family)
MTRLQGKVALITGAGSGIGRESSLLWASEGASIVAVDVDQKAAQHTADDVQSAGGRAVAVQADVSRAEDCERMIAQAESDFGRLNILFNNAGIMHSQDDDAVSTDEAVWDVTMNVNAKGVFFGCKYGIPALRRAGGGAIVNTASCGDAASGLHRKQGRSTGAHARARHCPRAREHPRQRALSRAAQDRAIDEIP